MRLPCTRATSVSARKLETFGSARVPQAEFECPQVRNPRWFPTGAFSNVTGSAGFSGAGRNPLKCRCMSAVFSEKGMKTALSETCTRTVRFELSFTHNATSFPFRRDLHPW
jgi:hypothetical protein